VATVLLAAVLWFFTFFLPWGVFWLKISFSAATLAGLSLYFQRCRLKRPHIDTRSILLGLFSALVLYFIFWAGKAVSTTLFAFAGNQIGSIYGKGHGTSTWMIVLLLFFVTGPCEEIYWRGYLQRGLMKRFGGWQGWLLATSLYSLVHVWSFNFMLIGAAAVAGAFWGAIYWRTGRLAPVIISHSIWSTVIFAVIPLS